MTEVKNSKILDGNIKELIAIGASVSANCHPCVKYHVGKAREMKIDEAEIRQAVEVTEKTYNIDVMVDCNDPLYRQVMGYLPEGMKISDYVVSVDVTAFKR